MSRTKYQWLDLIRGLSALLVCANHLRAAMFVDYSTLQSSSILVRVFYLATGLGSQSVIVFFVLSGFFVGGSVVRNWNDFSYSNYLLSRLSRLWIVLVPALILTILVDEGISRLVPGLLHGSDITTLNSGPGAEYSSSAMTFLQNMVFLQTVSGPVFGSNGPLWSLSNEFWYYICFPLLVALIAPRSRVGVRVAAAIALAACGGILLPDKIVGFAIWIMGVVAFCIPHELKLFQCRLVVLPALACFLASLSISKAKLLPSWADMLVLGLASSMLIVALTARSPMPRLLASLTDFFARASYTLYLVHFPLILLAYAAFFRGAQMTPTVPACLLFVGLLLALVFIAQIFWMLFERHTERVKAWLTVLLGRRKSVQP